MLMTEENIDIFYREYKKQLNKTIKYAKSRGGIITPRGENVMNRTEFKTYFIGFAADSGEKSGMKIARDIAKDQVYELSHKQAVRAAERAATLFGDTYNINEIMRYRIGARKEIFDYQHERIRDLMKSGLTIKEAKKAVSQEIWGSL